MKEKITVKQAVDRVQWRIKSGGWKANQNDIEAINLIFEIIESKLYTSENPLNLIYKLVLTLYKGIISHKGLSFNTDALNDYFVFLVNNPVSFHLETLKTAANALEADLLLKEKGLDTERFSITNPQSLKGFTEEEIKLVVGTYSYEDIEDWANIIIPQIIKKLSDGN